MARRAAASPAVSPATPPQAVKPAVTLAIDIGGTRLKAGILDGAGLMTLGPVRTNTPHPSGPAVVVDDLVGLAAQLGHFDRISVGFPGVVRSGRVLTAPNLGTDVWHGFPLGPELSSRLAAPCRVLNDASVQGLGVIAAQGLECVITLGTGFGFALFQDGVLAPHLEIGQHPVSPGGKTYDKYLGNAALHKAGRSKWNRRLQKAIAILDTLIAYDTLLIGGGNAQVIDFDLPANVRVVANSAGITGGVKLWDPRMEGSFGSTGITRGPPAGITPAPEPV